MLTKSFLKLGKSGPLWTTVPDDPWGPDGGQTAGSHSRPLLHAVVGVCHTKETFKTISKLLSLLRSEINLFINHFRYPREYLCARHLSN